ncbi:serine-rich adhesin for platelets-like isoform X1 [Senna tora]|uniref:Serine-rich adhesin for platelets-like isoform X1 n=1 Tax=Senna tora TaxID=362788 RepID=A0A834WD03_9FABA|nr:serine-rich adhesin for platelets-like isoform X1 [Senna tora]
MEAERRLLRRRKPLSDLTNTDSHTRPSSQSSSSTASVVKSPKPYSSSSFNNPVATKCNSPTSNTSPNRHHASNPSHLPPPLVTTPSRPLISSSLPGTLDPDDSDPISVAFRRRHTSAKRNCNDASKPSAKRNCNDASKSSFLQSSIVSTPSQLRKTTSVSVAGSSDRDVSEPISIVYSRRHTSDKRKGKEKVVADPFSTTPMPKTFKNREKNDLVEGGDQPKAKALTVPCRKKQRTMSSKKDVFQLGLTQDFIEKQQAYFKEIDNFELPVEEVESADELDYEKFDFAHFDHGLGKVFKECSIIGSIFLDKSSCRSGGVIEELLGFGKGGINVGVVVDVWSELYASSQPNESRAARVRISAQDTTPGHAFSTCALMSSITLNPLAELLFAAAVFSPMKLLVSSNNIDKAVMEMQSKQGSSYASFILNGFCDSFLHYRQQFGAAARVEIWT